MFFKTRRLAYQNFNNLFTTPKLRVSPYINRFLQPDSIIPNPANPQNWNRLVYVLNNPIRYNDPTGHDVDCGIGDSCEQLVIQTLKIRYNWTLKGNWSLDELDTIYQTGREIETYVDDLTGGMGQEWMNEYLGDTNITQWNNDGGMALPGWLVGENTIYLDSKGFGSWMVSHELGHIWDMNTGITWPWGTVGGVGDALNTFIGGSISLSPDSRFENDPGKPASPHIPSWNFQGIELIQFNPSVVGGYGNGSTADYLAESFAWNVVDRQKTPIVASVWVDQAIIAQAAGLP